MKVINTELQTKLISVLENYTDATFQPNDADYHDLMSLIEELRPKRVRRKAPDGGTTLVAA